MNFKRPLIKVWKFQDFQSDLREISFGDSKGGKPAILTHLDALNLIFMNSSTLRRLKSTKPTKFTPPKITKPAVLELLPSSKLISRKI